MALKKTSGSTASRDMLLLPSHQPEKGMMTRSARTGSASAMSPSFRSSVEDRFHSSPGDSRPNVGQAQEDAGTAGPPANLLERHLHLDLSIKSPVSGLHGLSM